MKIRATIIGLTVFLTASTAQAQIKIGGNVYGGGNHGDTGGSTSVEVRAGDIGRVFGGARMADVNGSAFVHIDGEHASDYILIDNVYGGNDIAGTIGSSTALPTKLSLATANGVTADWNAFVRISSKMNGIDVAADAQKIYIGQLFGGGNGDYDYTSDDYKELAPPALARTYLELLGGSIVNVFGGGNKANVTTDAVICVDNPSEVVNHMMLKDGVLVADDTEGATDLLNEERFKKMGFNYKFTYPNDAAFQIGNLFGGNNKVDMAIRPKWYLKGGKVRNLYSGGNEGSMTSSEGLLLEIQADSKIIVDNVYGGCRRADVRPKDASGSDVANDDIQLSDPAYKFPAGFSARVLVRGGDVNNVYGGNDISGNVYGGNAVGIYTSIRGSVYGGGNGSYSYTDNEDLKDDMIWKDFYYNPAEVLAEAGKEATSDELKSVEALNLFRPNAEQVSIRIKGESETKPTVIGKSIFVGGNSASVKQQSDNPIDDPKVHLKIGSYAIADTVFLGNNGIQMVDGLDEMVSAGGVLARYAGTVTMADGTTEKNFSSLDLTKSDVFAKYMEGCAMWEIPGIVFDSKDDGDPDDYEDYSSTFGAIYCGGNVGSMILDGKTTIDFKHKINVFGMVVGGCNNANVPVKKIEGTATEVCARYEGGFMTPGSDGPTVGDKDTPIADKLELNMTGLRISPKRWKTVRDANYETEYEADGVTPKYDLDTNGNYQLEWNTVDARTGKEIAPPDPTAALGKVTKEVDGWHYRLKGGNIYGGCYNSGHIDGNVVINLTGTVIDRDNIFAKLETEYDKLYGHDEYTITQNNSGVILDLQGMDALGLSLNVFGGGYGADSEIWGSTTINLTEGYTFQIFGGGENGAVGRGGRNSAGKLEYNTYDPRFSTYITMHGANTGVAKGDKDDKDITEAEFIYGGGFEGAIAGDTHVYLGNGRIFNSFAGSCNADIQGHAETYVGSWTDKNGNTVTGFPWVRDHLYGGNDLGGRIKGSKNFINRVREDEDVSGIRSAIYAEDCTMANAYVEYQRGRVEYIFGGCYGSYDYTDRDLYSEFTNEDGSDKPGFTKPHMGNAFVNFRPDNYSANVVSRVYGAGQGYTRGVGINEMQERSYVLIDIPGGTNYTNFEDMAVFGAGAWGGLGMGVNLSAEGADVNQASAVIDLFRGNIKNVYGASFNEGVTRRTVVNVPAVSTITVANIFGGGYGMSNANPCDAYEANVNYRSENATVTGALYGGNNNARRTLYGKVNVYSPVYSNKANGYTATVYGAGLGEDTWSQYTEVNLERGANVYEAYGGGRMGKVMNRKSVEAWKTAAAAEFDLDLTLGNGYTDTGLDNTLVTKAALDNKPYNSNVHVKEGATVSGYCYGGGLGSSDVANSGDVYGTTYIDLLGGTVQKDLYAAGTSGSVMDRYDIKKDDFEQDFMASTTAYIKGGTARNVYGGGWAGSVGKHEGGISSSTEDDIPGETHVVIGDIDGNSFTNGIPAIQRNAYGGGEGGAVFGTANITLNNGYIGYVYNGSYEEKINDETWTDHVGENRLFDSGCVFGGGYIDNSSVDHSYVTMFNGHVRNSLFGGGEIAAIGRGETNTDRTLKGIYKAGTSSVKMYDGFVGRDVFGGGRGYNNLGEKGTLYSDGFVFGKTEVVIHGGEIGTDEGVALGYGNVFGGGDIGFVYSAYEEEKEGALVLGRGKKAGTRYDGDHEGYYYKSTDDIFDTDGTEYMMTEDCKVLIEPKCRKNGAQGNKDEDFVGIDELNMYGNKSDTRWSSIDDKGIIIHNAVFAGGNTSTGSDDVFANSTTVFGNATASIHDIYHRDLITIGTGHTGGLYGDGNLTFVDGYRGLNITNYGTDYYSIKKEITYDEYVILPAREAAYYELRYQCVKECTDNEGTVYKPEREEDGRTISASTITADELLTLFKDVTVGGVPMLNADGTPNSDYWVEHGVCSRYAGRIMNTIQRADFCGVFGSRMVMQGAPDRVPEVVDYTNYTINRVREVSLNKRVSDIVGDANTSEAYHGNYFGIYNIVNFLGGLTSDVDFGSDTAGEGAVRTSDNTNKETYGPDSEGQTFYQWKQEHHAEQKRNNGNSHNQVALASGVYLELTTEKGTGTGLYEKDWGYITGVVELDLINVQTGVGGGFVYAKNEHGVRSKTNKKHITLTLLNQGAATKDDYTYTTDDNSKKEWQTSGNFVHSTQIIIDDCYNISGKYKTEYKQPDGVPAHYWFIKGEIYVYDQYISAYTGAPNAYSETVNIPLTITAASHGTMKLLDVKSNLFAYYAANTGSELQPLDGNKKLIINEVTYEKNTPISYWDWKMLTKSEQKLFVNDTYVVLSDCKIGGTDYTAGTVLTAEAYEALSTSGAGNTKPTATQKKMVDEVEQDIEVDFDFVVRPSNNMSHDTGFILTYQVNNPTNWDKWYTPVSGSYTDKLSQADFDKLTEDQKKGYEDGPTYRLTSDNGGVFGQREYKVSSVIAKSVYDTYQEIKTNHSVAIPTDDDHKQAEFAPAYIVTSEIEKVTMKDGTSQHLFPGARLSKTDFSDAQWAVIGGSVDDAYLCTSTIQLTKTENIYTGTLMTKAEKDAYYDRFKDGTDEEKLIAEHINDLIVPAYYCTSEGLYGGNYYEPNKNYRGLEAWCSMSDADRQSFEFNYDALDLLIDPAYGGTEGQKYQYDSKAGTLAGAQANGAHYSLVQPVDYTATYNGDDPLVLDGSIDVIGSTPTNTLSQGDEISSTVYEQSLINEKRHFAPISVSEAGDYYVVHTGFQHGETPYAVGQAIEETTYSALGDDQRYVTKLTFDTDAAGPEGSTYYFCREPYAIGSGTLVTSASDVSGATDIGTDGQVGVGVVISQATYNNLKNQQLNFTIHGIAPVETTTLYVSRNSDINDLSTEKIITVIYQYDYEESDEAGIHITPISERHVVNIHIKFKSGVPTVEDISTPKIVLPGTSVSIRTPNVMPGAYEVTGGGWELFQKKSDAESHINGVEYTPTRDPLYWYQNEYYLAYYAQTFLGKTYSNDVKVSVANYHDLAQVMGDKEHHYYIDHEDVDRKPKIYINDYSGDENPQNGLDLFRNLIDLTHVVNNDSETGVPQVISGGELDGHMPLDLTHTGGTDPKPMKGGEYLEFFLRSDQDHSGSTWTPIADKEGECFMGTFHGDGYTISGLDHSLFNHLCGDVYNLGVTGSFTGAGIAETGEGYVENCWISTSSTAAKTSKPIFGSPTITEGDNSRPIRIVNSYYLEDDDAATTAAYTNHTGTYGTPIRKPAQSFYNGEVAYDLNGFYLNKRYYDHTTVSGTRTSYQYFKANADGTLSETPATAYYPASPDAKYGDIGYVEERFKDGDFIYAGGTIPDNQNERLYITEESSDYCPVWPDDYLFFGQMLTYGYHEDTRPYQPLPAHINKSGNRLASLDTDPTKVNRVYRAPAYFQSKEMGVAHYNPYAVFAAQSEDKARTVYPKMTAIDFTGSNGDVAGGYKQGLPEGAKGFYPPLLDNDGLTFFRNVDLTKNLLAYIPSATADDATTAASMTNTAVMTTLNEPDYVETNTTYRTVDRVDATHVTGHPVVQNGSAFLAPKHHFLVDKQDFNAPMAYTFASDKLMFYQRTPELYVDRTKGWEGISLPFSAELVTTQTKGEITHFYGGSTDSYNGTNTKLGHEYWLREFKGNLQQKKDDSDNVIDGVYTADFNWPAAGTDGDKEYTNTFLWDYYYQYSLQRDRNSDKYQTYYESAHTHPDYGYSQPAQPYIIGFPGSTYYEFDLSGTWEPKNTYTTIGSLPSQMITFVSPKGTTIAVSDDEIGEAMTANKHDGYIFTPNYLAKDVEAGAYVLDAEGSSYKVTAAVYQSVPFRPYFTAVPNPSRGSTRTVSQIVFGQSDTSFGVEEEHGDPRQNGFDGTLNIYAKKRKIVVESSLNYTADLRIVTPAGITVSTFSVEPGEIVEVRADFSGMYIVHTLDNKYIKKVAVKRE